MQSYRRQDSSSVCRSQSTNLYYCLNWIWMSFVYILPMILSSFIILLTRTEKQLGGTQLNDSRRPMGY